MRLKKTDKKQKHLLELSDKLKIKVKLRESYRFYERETGFMAPQDDYVGGAAHFITKRVHIYNWNRKEKDNMAYFVFLHELGHIANKHISGVGNILESEAEAWVWALENAIDSMEELTIKAFNEVWLGGYIKQYGTYTAGPTFTRLVQECKKEGILNVTGI